MTPLVGTLVRLAVAVAVIVAGFALSNVWTGAFVVGTLAAPFTWLDVRAGRALLLTFAVLAIGVAVFVASATLGDGPDDGLWVIGVVLWSGLFLLGAGLVLCLGPGLRGWRSPGSRVGEL